MIRVHRSVSAVLVLGSLTVSARAQAAPIPEDSWCPLTRSPISNYHALPDDLKCASDQDGNNLDDEIEKEIARCVVPELRFDPEERWHRRGPGSPFFEPCPEGGMFANNPLCPSQEPLSEHCCGSAGWW